MPTYRNLILLLFCVLLSVFLPCLLFSQQPDINKVVPCRKGNKWGLVYPDGTVFYPAVLDSVRLQNRYIMYSAFSQEEYDANQTAIVKKSGKWWLLNSKGKLLPPDPATLALIRPSATAAPKADASIREIIPGDVQLSDESLKRILSQKRTRIPMTAKNGSRFELLDSAGEVQVLQNGLPVPGLKGDQFYASRDGDGTYRYFILERKGKQAVVDANSLAYKTAFEYDYVSDFFFEADWKLVRKGENWGVVDGQYNIRIPIRFQLIYGQYGLNPADSLPAIVKEKNQFRLYWYASGDAPAAGGVYDSLRLLKNHPDRNRYAIYQGWRDGKTGLIDYRDSILLDFQYDSIAYSDATSLLLVKRGRKYGFYNILTGYRREPEFDSIMAVYRYGNINKGSRFYILQVRKGRNWYFTDMNGKVYLCQ